MSPGYGNQIYRSRKFPLLSIIFIMLLAVLIILMVSLRRDNPDSVESNGPGASETRASAGIPDSVAVPVPDQTPMPEQRADTGTGSPLRQTAADEVISNPGSEAPLSAGDDRRTRLQARKFFENREYRRALAELMKVSSPGFPDYRDRGVCYYYLEEYDAALAQFQAAASAADNDPVTLKFMAFTLYKMDDLDESLRWIERALAIENQPELAAFRDRLNREISAMKGYADRRASRFRVIFSRFEHDEIRHTVTDILKNANREIGRQLDCYPRRVITVVLYNEKAFFDITRVPAWVGGLYDGKIRIPVKGVEGQETLLKRVLFHEYTHALIRDITPKCPLWLHEGLAEYFSTGDRAIIGQVFPLGQLEQRFPGGNPVNVILAYRESYSAVSELISRFGLYRIKELLQALGTGEDLASAFESTFMITYESFKKNWGRGQGEFR